MSLLKKGNVLSLSVEDDGVGFDLDKAMKISKGKGLLGLVIMRERGHATRWRVDHRIIFG